MKKIISCLMIFIIIALCFSNYSFAATPKFYISVGSGSYAITINSDTTISDVISVLGQPKIETDSAFGGKAYTFYTDNNYSNHLYLETKTDGTIISYGSADPTFKAEKYDYLNSFDYSAGSTGFSGLEAFGDDGKVYGGCWYTVNNSNSNLSAILQDYENRYNSDPIKYLKSINQHAIVMYNKVSKNLGKDANLVFDEDVFYTNEQFKEFGSSLNLYITNNNRTSYRRTIGARENTYIAVKPKYFQEFVLSNLAIYAQQATGNLSTDFSRANAAVFDYNPDSKKVILYAVDKNLFNTLEADIPLTSEEETKLNNGRNEYAKYLNSISKVGDSLFTVEPVYETPGGLVAGTMDTNVQQALLHYNNAIRTAGGLQKFSLDSSHTTMAQHKATLLEYRKQKLGLPMDHVFPKPDGVSDSYYQTAMGYNLTSFSECIGWTTFLLNKKTYFNEHINNYYDDASDLSGLYGHRTSLLTPKFNYISFGAAKTHDVIEVGGTGSTDVTWRAWPSKGVTFMETLYSKHFMWQMQFLSGYTIQDITKVKVKCLNTNQVWEFNEEESSTNRSYSINDSTYTELKNRVLFYDNTITPEDGFVYEITLKDVKNNSTGNNVDYTYRAIFKSAVEVEDSLINDLSISVPSTMTQKSDGSYEVVKDTEYKLNAIIDNNSAKDNHIEWTSSNPSAVSVMQNGLIKINQVFDGTVTITAKNSKANKTATIVLKYQEEIPIQQLFILYNEEFVEGHPEMTERSLFVTFYPSNTTMSKVLDYYSVNEDVASINERGVITVHKPGTVKFIVTAFNGVSEEYNKTYTYADLGLEEPKPLTGISLNKTSLTLKNGGSQTLTVTFNPTDTTDDKTILWSSNNTSVATVDSNGKVTCKACEGTATITATSKANSSIKATCKITASHKDSKLTLHSAVAATCNKAGNTAYYTCSGCDNYYSDEAGKNKISDKSSVIVPIDVNAHTWDNGKVTKEATCTANGEKTFTCKNNSSHTKKETINATGHTIVEVPFVKPTYEKEGNIEHYKCSKCNKLFSDSQGKTETTAQKVKLEKMPFKDVEYGKWYVDYVKTVSNKGWITGYKSGDEFTGYFGPNDNISRAQVATILYRMAGSPSVTGTTGLKDESTFRNWYKNAVIWAFKNEIITGYKGGENAGKFMPNNNVTREELMVMLMRYAKNIKKLNVTVNQSLSDFPDSNQAHTYALDGIKWAVKKEVVTGKEVGGKLYLEPLGTATRAQTAKMITVLYGLK